MSALLLSALFVLYPPLELAPRGTGFTAADEAASYARPAPPPAVPARAAADGKGRPAALTHAAAALPSPVMHHATKDANPPATAILALAGAASANNSTGLDPALTGRLFSGAFPLGGFMVPLPAGRWMLLANSTLQTKTASGTSFFLGRVEHKRLVGAMRGFVARSKDTPGAGFPQVKGCVAPDPTRNAVVVEEVTPYGNQACWRIHSLFTGPWNQWADRAIDIDTIDRAAAGDLAAKGVSFPQDLVDVRFARFTLWGAMAVEYLFSPEAEGIKSTAVSVYSDMDWRGNNIGRFPEKVAYVNKLKDWASVFWPQFKVAFANAEQVAGQAGTP